MLIIFCLALAYAIQGAASQAWNDGRTAVADTVQRHRRVMVATRTSDHRGVRAAGAVATVLSWLAGGAWRVARSADRSLAAGAVKGWRHGWQVGRHRRDDLRAARDARRAERESDGTPSWRHYLTGECPTCGHLPKASEAATDGCECPHSAWGCPCALRFRSKGRVTPPEPPPCPPDEARPVPDPVDPDPIDHTKGDPMTTGQQITGEASSIEATRAALEAITASAAADLDSAQSIHQMAKSTSAAAEQMLADLTTADLDGQTLADITAVQEAAAAQEAEAQRLLTSAEAIHSATATALAGMNERHRNVEEAVNATAHAAATDWYRG